ncbi:hypothetical protein XENTR_v10018205 [Xenopus tropicalis]|nr:hypothetical protein XENTR_v10018205 [Xenopus tropicalis]
MASARRFFCFRKLFKPFFQLCNIQNRSKNISNHNNEAKTRKVSGFFSKLCFCKKTKTLEEEPQTCADNVELNTAVSTCITEEVRNELPVPCKAEQERSTDFSACADEEQVCELSTLCLIEESPKEAAIVELEETTESECKDEEEQNLSTKSLEEERSETCNENQDDSTTCKKEEQKTEPDSPLCKIEEHQSKKKKKTRKVARKGKKNNKQTIKVELEENPSTICLKEENSKKMARKERKAKKRLIKAEIEKRPEWDSVGLYKPLYACRSEPFTYKTEECKPEPDFTPWMNMEHEITPFSHERRDKKEARKGRKYNRQTIKAEEKNKREKITDEYKSRTRFYADEENEFSDDSEYIGVPGQPFPDGTDAWIPELNLTQEHKMALRGRECLDDRIIDAAQSLLKIQFEAEGLQSCLLSQIGFHAVKGPSVQIHYDSVKRHWLTSCFKMDHVEIADSAVTKHHCTLLRKQINDCYSELVNDPEGTMETLDVDEQENNHDCGVYAIANAFEFLSGGTPICKYESKKMRRHLIGCFETRKFTEFPKKVDACVVELEPKLNITWLDRK